MQLVKGADDMTGRERLLKAFRGEPTDRVPISPWIYNNFIYEFFDIELPDIQEFLIPKTFDIEQKTIEVFEFFGFDLIHRLASIWDYMNEKSDGDMWLVERKKESYGERIVETTTITTPERKLTQVKEIRKNSKYTYVEAITEYFIKESEDFEQFLKYQPGVLAINCDRITRTRKLVGDKGLVLVCIHGAYNFLNMFRRLDDLMVDPYLDEGLYREMMRYFLDRSKILTKQMIDAGADIVNVAINMANGSSVGPEYFKKYVLEYEKELNEFIMKEGCFAHNHNCGDAKSLLDIYRDLPMDAYESLTSPPFGDTDLDEALEKFDKATTLLGNIDQVKFLVEATPEQVKDRVKGVIEKGKKRGNFILSTSDWIFDGTPYENIKAFVEAGMEYGRY